MAHHRSTWVRWLAVLSLGAVVAVGLPARPAQAQKKALTVYTAVEADDLKKYAARFNEDHPDIEIKWVRDSTGIVTAKLLAEKANPQADVIWGLAATSLMVLKREGLLMPYAPKGVEKLDRAVPRQAPTRRPGSAWTPGWRRSASTPSRPRSRTCPSRRPGRTSPSRSTRATS